MSTKFVTGFIIAGIALLIFILFAITSSWLFEWYWISELDYEQVFITKRITQVIMAVVSFLIAVIFVSANLRFMAGQFRFANIRQSPLREMNIQLNDERLIKRLRQILTLGAIFISIIFASAYVVNWDNALRFLWSSPMNEADPLFNRDIAFYMFELPFWELVQTTFTVLVFFTLMILTIGYIYTGIVQFSWSAGIIARKPVYRQLAINVSLWLLLLACSFFLDRYQMLYESEGVVFGAGYTDVNIVLPALWIIVAFCVFLSVMVFASQWMKLHKAIIGMGALVIISLVLGRAIIPGLVQQFDVDANELERERPYLEKNIEMTRLAYGLNNVEQVEYTAEDTLTLDNIRENQDIIDNIRLWDPRLLIRTYRQLQEIRPYYQFNDVDVDRYEINGQREQVMLSARELAPQLPDQSDTWVNRHMQFTHGLGMVMSPVTRSNSQGEPIMYVKDIPPSSEFSELEVENPAVYYGEESHNYYIVNTHSDELHYPRSGDNVYKHYQGSGGIQFSNWFRKFLIAWEMGDINVLLSDEIHEESRFQVWRGVQERIRNIAPFLKLDEDPYLVLKDGRMHWIQDAYTTTTHFPYSEPAIGGNNYIRNSVKIIVDAYEGTVDFYIVDDEDPIIRLYDNIFPDLFKDRNQVPEGFEEHFRYPQNLFETQLELYNRYHMTNPRVFYNNEDRWLRPYEKYAGQRRQMEPYYIMTKLPGSDELQYMIMSPVTPEDRNNMISWMSAISDPENYGQLISFQLPRERLIYGPIQIESRIDQDPEISRQIALWDQRGSNVIRGNLMVIPVGNSFLYVEPVFLLADRDDIPQLQRVIVAIGEEISMQPTLEAAIADLFGVETGMLGPQPMQPVMPGIGETQVGEEPREDIETHVQPREIEHFNEVREVWKNLRESLDDGDWARFGELLEELDDLIED